MVNNERPPNILQHSSRTINCEGSAAQYNLDYLGLVYLESQLSGPAGDQQLHMHRGRGTVSVR